MDELDSQKIISFVQCSTLLSLTYDGPVPLLSREVYREELPNSQLIALYVAPNIYFPLKIYTNKVGKQYGD
jgi:hypothetical protein